MTLQKRQTWWVQRPTYDDPDDESIHDYEYLKFRLAEEWFSINSRDQLVLPVVPLERLTDGAGLVELDADPGILAQYGGAELVIDMMSGGTEPTAGTEWYVEYDPRHGFGVVHVSDYAPPFEWVETEVSASE